MPSLAGFLAFIRTIMAIPVSTLADADPSIGWAYTVATDLANDDVATLSAVSYAIMVYNLAADTLINIAQDTPPATYFTAARSSFGLGGFTAGVVQGSSDNGTSTSLAVPDILKGLTLADLQLLKTPYGRTYLAYAQKFGSVWGLT